MNAFDSFNPSPSANSAPSSPTLLRDAPNFFALACSILFLLSFLFLPIVSLVIVPISGWFLMFHISAIWVLPVVCGVCMLLSSLLFEPKVGIVMGCASAVITAFLYAFSDGWIRSSTDVIQQMGTSMFGSLPFSLGDVLPIRIGMGMVLCVTLSLLFSVLEWVLGQGVRRSHRRTPLHEDPWPTR